MRRTIFYAESWLLTHMLLHGRPDRTARLSAYIDAIASNMSAQAAWEKAFAGDDLGKALRLYATQPLVASRLYTLSEKIARASGQSAPLTPAAAEATFGELSLAVGDKEAAAGRFKRALALDGGSRRAAIGAAEAAGETPPVTALSPSDDWLDDYLVAAAIVHGRSRGGGASSDAIKLLEHAAERHPVPNMFGLIAEAAGDEGALSAADIDGLRRAHESAPARDDYSFALARSLAAAGRYADARNVLGTLIGHPHWKTSRDPAMRMMRWVVEREQRATMFASEPAPAARDEARAAAPASGAGTAESAVDTTNNTESDVQPLYRDVQPGEQRAEGFLEQVACDSGKPVVVTVRYPDRVVRYQAARLTDIEFITYEPAKGGRFSCGPRVPPDRVFLTWKIGAGGTAIVVAVEFLPKNR